MKLHQLLDGISYSTPLNDIEITIPTSDSRQIEPGCLYICIKGLKFDGHEHAGAALQEGAAAVVTEKDLGLPQQVIVENTRAAYGVICANYFGNPSRGMKLIGVTGTNGKTTITNVIKQVLEGCGKKVGLIGTIQNEIDDMTIPAKYTTPDPMQLQSMFLRMAQAGCEYVVMETSSHALDQHRLAGCHFVCGVFTNLTQDHLDYHITMENYYQAKKKLFDLCDFAVINMDDEYGRRLAAEVPCPVQTFSTGSDNADYTAKSIKITAAGSQFALVGNHVITRVKFCMPGTFSVSNAMAAAVCCLGLGFTLEEVTAGLESCHGVSGRFEVLYHGDFTVIRDYAHSPDGLEKILTAVKEFAPGRVVALFGCAGNRDRTKRPKMGEIASRLANFAILTSDNPRDEDPQQIVNDALPGLLQHDTPHEVIVDRYAAIEWALQHAQKDDMILLLGKGHEDYQVLRFGTIYFDEKVIVRKLLNLDQEEEK